MVEDMIDEEERRVKSDEIQSLKKRKAVEKDIRLAVSWIILWNISYRPCTCSIFPFNLTIAEWGLFLPRST